MASDLPDEVDQVDEPSIVNGDRPTSTQAPQHAANAKETEDVLHSDVRIWLILQASCNGLLSIIFGDVFMILCSPSARQHTDDGRSVFRLYSTV